METPQAVEEYVDHTQKGQGRGEMGVLKQVLESTQASCGPPLLSVE